MAVMSKIIVTEEGLKYLDSFGIAWREIAEHCYDTTGYWYRHDEPHTVRAWPKGFDYFKFTQMHEELKAATPAKQGVAEIAKDIGIKSEQVPAFAKAVGDILTGLEAMLIEKNAAYGNSALDPVRIFSSASTEEQLLVRIDDKLSRLQRGHEYAGDDTVKDLIGYLILLLIAREG